MTKSQLAIDVALGRDPSQVLHCRLEGETLHWTLSNVETGTVTLSGCEPIAFWRKMLLGRIDLEQ